MVFAKRLLQLRKERGFSQEDLAERVGVSRQAAAKWESGESMPEIDKLIALSALFGTSIDRLVVAGYDDCAAFSGTAGAADEGYGPLLPFLLRAKRATYAGKGAESEPWRPASHDLRYAEEDLLYIDTYLGGERFAGEEALWRADEPLWAMNYVGRVLGEGFSGDFLKEALSLGDLGCPYRGPRIHRNGEFVYHCIVDGGFPWFTGHEEIFRGTARVYECRFHGGAVS